MQLQWPGGPDAERLGNANRDGGLEHERRLRVMIEAG